MYQYRMWHTRLQVDLTSVNGSTGVLELEFIVTELNLLQFHLPVRLPPDRDVLDLATVRGLIDPSEDGFTAILFRATETEGEHGRVDELLVHHVVEGRGDVVHSNGVIAQAEDTIEPSIDTSV